MLGSTVTVRGLVTNGNEFGKIRYIQDGTAGIGCFPGTGSQAGFETTVVPGDSIEVTGKVVDFQNLLEISPITAWSVISSGNPQPTSKPLAFSEIGEAFEGQLVSIDCAAFAGAGGLFSSQNTYLVNSPDGATAEVYVRGTNPIIGSAIPVGTQRITGVLSQYSVDYQLLPRSVADFSPSACFFITQPPVLVEFSKTSLKINWKTNLPSASKLQFGTTPSLGQEAVSTAGVSQNHEVELTGLIPGSIYWVKAVATSGSANAESDEAVYATESESTGEIRVYFTKAIDVSVGGASPALPNGTTPAEAVQEIYDRIDSAEQTIDVAVYNIDQTDLRDRLEAAVARGVQVRYICAEETANTALEPPPTFPVVHGNHLNLMHNKFVVCDANSPLKSWVMSGSMNWTYGSIYQDYNNVLWVQDQSLARTYRLEFEEMWGSSGPQPDLSAGLFGSSKKDNTPHFFRIGGRPVESRFSPSDLTTVAIEKTLLSADHDLSFALLTFTKDELGAAVVNREQAGVSCRGVIDNPNDNGSELNYLLANGVKVKGDDKPAVIHHKYGVVDAFLPTSDPTVETGSHNWSLTAETGNDENTLVLHDAKIAMMYAMEFENRFNEITVGTTGAEESGAIEIYPNPTAGAVWVKCPAGSRLEVFDAMGKLVEAKTSLGDRTLVSLESRPSGIYFIKSIGERAARVVPVQKI